MPRYPPRRSGRPPAAPDRRPRYRALSLDLWFTTISHGGASDVQWDRARLEVLGDLLAGPGRRPVAPARLRSALTRVRARLAEEGRSATDTAPRTIVEMVARTARAQLRVRPGVAGRQFSDAGLLEFPPRINPEAVRVSAQLAAAGVPVVSVTNTGRSAATWRWFFQTHSGPRFATVVASCDLGTAKPAPEIFLEAARRLRLPPASVLHVGDRWDLDVGGAVAAGLGAALYRGLWHAYPPGLYPAQAKPRAVRDVARIDQLEELLERVRFATRRSD